jgi:hypothetical protein
VLRVFIALKNPSSWPGFEPGTFGSSGQHTNNYTTKATKSYYMCLKNMYVVIYFKFFRVILQILCSFDYWLLLVRGVEQSVPSTATIF